MDPMAQGVQPDAGQGAAPGDAPYAEYLNRIPEEHRGIVEPLFREWDGNVTKRFQEHSEYRRQWEPYEQMGVNQYDPEGLAGLIEFAKLANDPTRAGDYRSWLEEQAQQHGLLAQQPDAGLDMELLDPAVQQLIEQRTSPLQQQLEQMTQWRQQVEQQQQQQMIQSQLNQEFEALQQEHGELPRDLIESFAGRYTGRDPRPIQRAFEDFQRFRGDIEQRVLAGKLNQPNAPNLQGTAPPMQGEQPKTLKDAEQIMAQRLAARQQM
jgi:hypothetical protein